MKTSETLWHGLNSSSGDCSFSSSLSIFRIKPFKLHFFSKEGLLPPLLAFDIRRKMSKHLWAMSIDLVGHFCTKKVKNVCCVKIYCCKYLRTDYSRDNSIFNRVHTDKKTPTFYHFGLQMKLQFKKKNHFLWFNFAILISKIKVKLFSCQLPCSNLKFSYQRRFTNKSPISPELMASKSYEYIFFTFWHVPL